MISKWDKDFLDLAKDWALKKSKDPSTKVGAVIARGRDIVSLGYNGFAKGVADLPSRLNDRELKYRMIVHGEANAIVLAKKDLTDCTLYTWPFMPCSICAGLVIQSGIMRVVAPYDDNPRWLESFKLTALMFQEAGVQLDLDGEPTQG